MSNPVAIGCLIPLLAARSAWAGLHSRLRPDPGAMTAVALPRCKAASTDLRQVLQRRQPVIIEGLTETLRPTQTAELDSLRRAARSNKDAFEVKLYDREAPYFLYTGDYGQKLLDQRQLTLDDFLRAMFDEEAFCDYAVYRLFDQRALDGLVGSIIDALAEALAERVDLQPEPRASGVWIGSRGVVTPLHYDSWPGLLFQTHGSKRVLMFSPEDIQRLYFTPQHAVGQRWSRLPARSGEADPQEFPLYSRATRHEGRLERGDALWIPPFWPHEIEALEPNISIPFRFRMATRDYFHPRFLRPACEVMDQRYFRWRRRSA